MAKIPKLISIYIYHEKSVEKVSFFTDLVTVYVNFNRSRNSMRFRKT